MKERANMERLFDKVLVTGGAGYCGARLVPQMLARGYKVTVYDIMFFGNQFLPRDNPNLRIIDGDIRDAAKFAAAVAGHDAVVNLACISNDASFELDEDLSTSINLNAFEPLVVAAKKAGVKRFVYASSSSVYGANRKLPFDVSDTVDHPVSLYGATKKANELMAHSYAHLFALPVTGLRFFTVYGPWGRPDMSLFLFTRKILAGEPIEVFNFGHHARDFTYIDDAVEGVLRTLDVVAAPNPDWRPEAPNPATSSAPYRLYNIGSHSPVGLLDYIMAIEKAVGRKAKIELLPQQPGDVEETYAGVEALKEATGFQPSTPLEEGIRRFVAWYRDYYRA
jgi:UDP-glucuronate 4-epimerase